MYTKRILPARVWLFALLLMPLAASSQSVAPNELEILPDRPQPQPDVRSGGRERVVYGAARGVTSGEDLKAYRPITGAERVYWVLNSTFGPTSLGATAFVSGIQTARNDPPEYGPHWDGAAKRFGIRILDVTEENTLEAGIGAIWGEDPRYFRETGATFGQRLKHAMVMTFAARRRDGSLGPAYARYIAVPADNFISNTWRVHHDNTAGDAISRVGWDFLGKMASNAFKEFWPDIKGRVFARNKE